MTVTAPPPPPPPAPGADPGVPGAPRRRIIKQILGRRLPTAAGIAAFLLAVIALALLTADLWRPLDTRRVDLSVPLVSPSWEYPMGTDNLGRDMLAYSLHGLRMSVAISLFAASVAVVIGAAIGMTAGTVGGRVDALAMRVVDVFASQSHFLFGLLILVLARPIAGPAVAIVLAVGLTHWVSTARIVRSELLSLRERPFVAACINAGATRRQVVWHHHLPNVLPPLVLAFVLTFPHAIFHETGYSFLGLGMPMERPSLGRVLGLGQANALSGGWWVTLFPGLLLFVTAACVGTLGEWWRDRHDPHVRSELQL